MTDLPDGWTQNTQPDRPYTTLANRDAVRVPKQRKGDGFSRDAVVVVTEDRAGVTTGPGARRVWETSDPEAVALALVEVLDEWITAGGDPYGGSDLAEQLDAAAKNAAPATGRVSRTNGGPRDA